MLMNHYSSLLLLLSFFIAILLPSTRSTSIVVDPDPIANFLQNSFIWCPVSSPGAQVYVTFQGNFTVPTTTSSSSSPLSSSTLLLHVFADVRYILFIDGNYVSRGPGRFNPVSPDYDTLNISSLNFVANSDHTITVMVHNYGQDAINGRIMFHSPGFTIAIEHQSPSSSSSLGSTDPLNNDPTIIFSSVNLTSWACSNGTEYLPSPIAWSSIPDAIDGRIADYRNWITNIYSLPLSTVYTPVPINGSTWGSLVARALPMPNETSLTPYLTVLPGNQPLTLPLTLNAGQSIILNVSQMAMIYVTMEFLAQNDGNVVTLDYALRYVDNNPSETYGTGTNYIARAGSNAVLAGDTWVNHYIIFSCVSGNITLRQFNITQRQYPFQTVGTFTSSDSLLNAIYDRALQTLRAVTDDAYGSDARERNSWLQDPAQPNFITTGLAFATVPSVYTSSNVYMNSSVTDGRLIRLLLRHASLGQLADGRLRATFPTDRGPSDCHYFIEDYSMQWIEALRWYYDTTMDTDFVASVWATLVLQMEWFANHVNPSSGLLLAREYTSFDDPLAYITLEGTALNCFYYKALLDSAYIATVLNNTVMANTYQTNATFLRNTINTLLWNGTVGSYNSGIMNNQILGPTPHAAMLALHKGIVPLIPMNNGTNVTYFQATMNFFLQNYGNPGNFHVCSNPDYEEMIANRAGINMTVSHYWVFNVLYLIDTWEGDVEVLARLRNQWGNMIVNSNDAGTLWESFADSESCHNYGAVPAWFLTTKVLGINLYDYNNANNNNSSSSSSTLPIPSQRQLVIEPHIGDLVSIQGSAVTPLGLVNISWSRSTAALPYVLSFTLHYPPNLLMLTFRIPDSNATTLYINNNYIRNTVTEGRYTVYSISNPGTTTNNLLMGNITLTTVSTLPVAMEGYTLLANGTRKPYTHGRYVVGV